MGGRFQRGSRDRDTRDAIRRYPASRLILRGGPACAGETSIHFDIMDGRLTAIAASFS